MPTSLSDRIRLALTLGDPAGIGPEVLVKALASWKSRPSARVLVAAQAFPLNALARKLKAPIEFADVSSVEGWQDRQTVIPCFFPDKTLTISLSPAKPQTSLTACAVRSIEAAVDLAMKSEVDAVVTPPIHKANLKRAGFQIPGHTEYLAKLSGAKQIEMMLAGGPLRVALVTRHEPIQKVSSLLTKKRISECILMTHRELRYSFGIKRPKLAVCGLNPHAGEEGTIGREERDVIAPAVAAAQQECHSMIAGPLSPDTVFYAAYQGLYDAVICMYHDQGLIPLKMISRGHGVNITLGLPFVRTSPDHGTAYDIAGKGLADPGSMIDALETAFQMARNRMVHDRKKYRR